MDIIDKFIAVILFCIIMIVLTAIVGYIEKKMLD